MKSWAKKPFTKAALSVIAVGMSIIVCLSGVMLIYKINDSEGKVVGVGAVSYTHLSGMPISGKTS